MTDVCGATAVVNTGSNLGESGKSGSVVETVQDG